MDFLVIEDFSYASTQTFSNDRWTPVGEAGGFIDAVLLARLGLHRLHEQLQQGLLIAATSTGRTSRADRVLQLLLLPVVRPDDRLYKDQYQFFGNPQVMLAKNLYDNTAYFSTLAFMFLHEKMTDLDVLADVVDQFQP